MMPNRSQPKATGRNASALLTVIFILTATLGCKRIAEIANKRKSDTPVPAASGTPAGGETDTREDSLTKKTNLYIAECFNKYSNRVVESYNRYAMWVKNMDQGPTGKEMNIYGLYDVNGDGSDCETAVQKAKQMEPSMPEIEGTADNYVTALKAVIEQIRGVYKYYDQQDYKDDNFAKGKAAHAPLIEAFKNFREANTVFADNVDGLEDQVAAQELEKLRGAPGKHYDFLVVGSGIKAKKIKTLLQDKQFEQIAVEDISPLIDDFGSTLEDLRAEPAKKTMSDMYVKACEDLAKASKEMMRRIRDKQAFNESEKREIAMGAGWMVDGSPAKIIKAYNDMIQQRRFLRF